jgi:hypothetical protein
MPLFVTAKDKKKRKKDLFIFLVSDEKDFLHA